MCLLVYVCVCEFVLVGEGCVYWCMCVWVCVCVGEWVDVAHRLLVPLRHDTIWHDTTLRKAAESCVVNREWTSECVLVSNVPNRCMSVLRLTVVSCGGWLVLSADHTTCLSLTKWRVNAKCVLGLSCWSLYLLKSIRYCDCDSICSIQSDTVVSCADTVKSCAQIDQIVVTSCAHYCDVMCSNQSDIVTSCVQIN